MKCTRCDSEEHADNAKYCKICGLKLIVPEPIFGDKVDAMEIGRYENNTQTYVYMPQIEVNKRMCSISEKDTETKSGSIECATFEEAIKVANVKLKEYKEEAKRV